MIKPRHTPPDRTIYDAKKEYNQLKRRRQADIVLLTSFMEVGHLFPFPFFKASAALNIKEQLLASIGAENYLDYMLGFIIAYGSYLELQMKIEEVCRILRRKPPAFITPCQMCRHNTSWLCFE